MEICYKVTHSQPMLDLGDFWNFGEKEDFKSQQNIYKQN